MKLTPSIKVLKIIRSISLCLFFIGLLLIASSYLFQNYINFDSIGYSKAITEINESVKNRTRSDPSLNHSPLIYDDDSSQLWNSYVQDSSGKIQKPLKYFFINSQGKEWYAFKTADTVLLNIPSFDSSKLNLLRALKDSAFKDSVQVSKSIEKIFDFDFPFSYPPYSFDKENKRGDTQFTLGVIFTFFIIPFLITFVILYIQNKLQNEKANREIFEETKNRIEQNPNEIKPSWDMAQLTLEQYFRRNLKQINMIFYVSVFVMLAGFILIGFGILLAYKDPDKTFMPLISSAAGLLTEFIGATFIFIYNSTIKQAISYTDSLQRINSVGMSVKIIDSIKSKDQNEDKLTDAKLEIAKMLLRQVKENIQNS